MKIKRIKIIVFNEGRAKMRTCKTKEKTGVLKAFGGMDGKVPRRVDGSPSRWVLVSVDQTAMGHRPVVGGVSLGSEASWPGSQFGGSPPTLTDGHMANPLEHSRKPPSSVSWPTKAPASFKDPGNHIISAFSNANKNNV